MVQGLRISEATNIRVEDIDSNNMRLFVRNGKGERERYTVLPKASLEMLRNVTKCIDQIIQKDICF